MLGQIDPKQNDVTIIGGGISGLLMAYVLDQKGYRVHLLEASDRLGGMIRTKKTDLGIAESAAHSILVTPEVKSLLDELGVQMCTVNPHSKARFILRNGKMRKFPLNFFEALRAFLRAYFVLADKKTSSDEMTLAQWASRFLGKPALNYLINPMVRVIYAASPEEINVSAAFPSWVVPKGHSFLSFQLSKLFRRKKQSPQKQKTRPVMMAPQSGMEDLVKVLEKRLSQRLSEKIQVGNRVEQLPSAGNVVLCVPALQAAELLRKVDSKLSKALSDVRYVPLVSVTVFIQRRQFKEIPKGTGLAIADSEKTECLGVLFNSSAFNFRVIDEGKWVSCTIMIGGTKNPKAIEYSDERIISISEQELSKNFGMMGRVSYYEIHRWPNAIPLYNSDLKTVWDIANSNWCSKPGHVIFGNYTGKVGLRGMIETLYESERISLAE